MVEIAHFREFRSRTIASLSTDLFRTGLLKATTEPIRLLSAGVTPAKIHPMPRKPKAIKPRRLYPIVPPTASWFESDSYDRRTWKEIVADAPSIADLTESGERLVPHFGALVQDLFLALFKMNPVMRKSDDVRLAATLNRTILDQLVPSAPFQALRSRTALEEDKAAIAALVMSEHALEMMKSERLVNRGDMADLFDLARQ